MATLEQLQGQVQQASTAIATAPAQAQQAWSQATSTSANDDRVDAGASAAWSLLKNGYDPDSSSDNQKLIAVAAGAVSCIPGVGPVLGGGLELIDQIGLGLGSVMQAIGLIPKPGCTSSGDWTPAMLLAQYTAQGSTMGAPGSFAALAWPVLAANDAAKANCKPGYDTDTLVLGLAYLWNQHASGEDVAYVFPDGFPSARAWDLQPLPASTYMPGFSAAQNQANAVNAGQCFWLHAGPFEAPAPVLVAAPNPLRAAALVGALALGVAAVIVAVRSYR